MGHHHSWVLAQHWGKKKNTPAVILRAVITEMGPSNTGIAGLWDAQADGKPVVNPTACLSVA